MASTDGADSFNVLGSSKLNTSDGKNPTSSGTAATQMQEAKADTGASDDDRRRQCQQAHDELEARLKDEELHGRSKGWSS